MEETYFIDKDDDGHAYVVPVSRRADWRNWCNLDSDDDEAWDVPDFAVAIGGSPVMVTFTNPLLNGKPMFEPSDSAMRLAKHSYAVGFHDGEADVKGEPKVVKSTDDFKLIVQSAPMVEIYG